MNDVIEVYDEMLKLYKSRKTPSSSWPIICIDEVNVLTQWQQGSLEKREALSALLKFFVKVGKSAMFIRYLSSLMQSQSSRVLKGLHVGMSKVVGFSQVTKEDNVAHVILATSDYAFLNWLAGGETALNHFLLEAILA